MDRIVDLLHRRIWIGSLAGIIVGLALGLLVGWVLSPVDYKPNKDDVSAIADSYFLNPSIETAKKRLEKLSPKELDGIFAELKRERPSDAQRFDQLLNQLKPPSATVVPSPVATAAPKATPTAVSPSPSLGDLAPLLGALAVAFIILIAGIILVPRLLPELRARRAGQPPAPRGAAAIPTDMAPTLPAHPGGLGRYVAAYQLGNDNYDTSFSLETPKQEFLGECGMGISETIGEGKPDKVTAFDVWLFDKGDVRTVTQVLMSEYAFNDPGLRSKLLSKGQPVLAEKGKMLRLETQSLIVDAQIIELVYAVNPNFAPNSHFQKLTVEVSPTLKTNGSS